MPFVEYSMCSSHSIGTKIVSYLELSHVVVCNQCSFEKKQNKKKSGKLHASLFFYISECPTWLQRHDALSMFTCSSSQHLETPALAVCRESVNNNYPSSFPSFVPLFTLPSCYFDWMDLAHFIGAKMASGLKRTVRSHTNRILTCCHSGVFVSYCLASHPTHGSRNHSHTFRFR